jgi:hypothetical protein
MPEFCTCGAQLPPDARFCHKCGKPQREELFVPPPEAPPPPIPIVTPAPPVAPSFRNPVAVRVGLFVASIATFLCLAVPFGFVIWLPSAGFTSVYLFSRRTGQSLTVRGGARMGWMAGILSFVIITVMFTLGTVAVSIQPGGVMEAFREAAKARPLPANQLEDVLQMLSSPAGQAAIYIGTLLFSFMVTSVFCTAGGALGAKVLEKD